VVVHQDEGVSDNGLKDFAWMGERFVDGALANRGDLDQVLLGIQKNNADRFAIEKAHWHRRPISRPVSGSIRVSSRCAGQ